MRTNWAFALAEGVQKLEPRLRMNIEQPTSSELKTIVNSARRRLAPADG
jgi:hypothetical protein